MDNRVGKPVYRERRRNRLEGSEWQKEGYDSRFEWTIANRLKEKLVDFVHQPTPLKYIKEHTYTPDFAITTRSGKVILIETKGYWLAVDRAKHKIVVAHHPEKDIRLVFMNANNKLNKGSNTTYADWCDRYKVKWSHLVLPDSWLNE